MIPTPFSLSLEQRQTRSLTQDVIPFLNNIIFQYTNPLSFETEPHVIHAIPLAREHCDSYLYYIRYKTLETTPSKNLFLNIFNPVQGINTGTYYRTVHPQNTTLSIQDVFITFMDNFIEHNEHQGSPFYLPSQFRKSQRKI